MSLSSSLFTQVYRPLCRASSLLFYFHNLTMDFAMEDNQNSAPGSVPAAKLNASRKGPDAQSVTKRYVQHVNGW